MKREPCPICQGILADRTIDYDKKIGRRRMLFEDVPAHVCASCGEAFIDGPVLEKIEEIFLKSPKPTRKITLPVWSYAKSA